MLWLEQMPCHRPAYSWLQGRGHARDGSCPGAAGQARLLPILEWGGMQRRLAPAAHWAPPFCRQGGHGPAWHRAGGAPERYSLIGVMRKACTASICSSLPDRQAEPVRRLVRSTMLKRRSQPLSSSR